MNCFYMIVFKNSGSQMIFKIAVLKNFADFIATHLCCSSWVFFNDLFAVIMIGLCFPS